MQTSGYNEWASCPINLSSSQITNPQIVISDFFSDDSLSGHLQRLKAWRDCVLKNDYYRDMKGSPAGLVYFYKLNICLVEAACLIRDKDANSIFFLPAEEIKDEQTATASVLNDNKFSVPLAVFKNLFDDHDLFWYREQLWEWLEHGLSVSAVREFIETTDLIFLYECLQHLYEAAWLFCKLARYKVIALHIDSVTDVAEEHNNAASIYRLNNIISADHAGQIKAIVSKIKHKLPSVQAIIDLGTTPFQPGKVFLLVLTANDEQGTAQSLCSMIEESCQKLANIVALVHHASSLFTGLENDHLFFKNALTKPVIYLSGDIMLPMPGITNNCTATV